jgi:hypothetical protein
MARSCAGERRTGASATEGVTSGRAGGAGGDETESQAGSTGAAAVAEQEVWAAADRGRGRIAKLQQIFSKKEKENCR